MNESTTLAAHGPGSAESAPPDSAIVTVRRTASTNSHPVEQPIRWLELISLASLVAISDLTIYRGSGFAGYAALISTAAFLFAVGMIRPRAKGPVALLSVMLLLNSTRLLWCGSGLSVAVGFGVLIALVACLAGHHPWIGETLFFAAQSVAGGYRGLALYGRSVTRVVPSIMRRNWLAALLPLLVLCLFSALFVFANPNLQELIHERLDTIVESIRSWLIECPLQPTEVLFWIVAAWIVAGFLRPAGEHVVAPSEPIILRAVGTTETPGPSVMYTAIRNTLLVVIVLFAAYLVFEFKTLWFRVFPDGFYYSGYAHDGAAWLTGALALATAILSAMFRGAILRDPRLPRLRLLAWAWSLENLLLAIAVYHRLFIYIGFNGMTRMRVVGLYGMSAVVVGFLWVVWKIRHHHDFVWLVRRHLWTLAAAIYLYAITPVDTVAMHYNVRRILTGDPAPSVQISVHPISAEGYLVLVPLVDSDDPKIAEGLKAMLAERDDRAITTSRQRQAAGWTSLQISEEVLRDQLRSNRHRWVEYTDPGKRASALEAFHAYAYQWF